MTPRFRRRDTGRSVREAAALAARGSRISQVAKSTYDTIKAHMIYERMLKQALSDGSISVHSAVLVVCGGSFERELFLGLGFTDVTISNLDEQYSATLAPYKWSRQDAENLAYDDNTFDIVFVHAGLHHCYSPHRGLLEMYRVARGMVIVIEARDSALLRMAKRLGLATDYEIEAVSSANFESGGVANGPIPNFIYRWTENEVLKTIKSFEPRYVPEARFFYGLRLPYQRFRSTPRRVLRSMLLLVGPAVELFAKIFPSQGNEFGYTIIKGRNLLPWLSEDSNGNVVVSKDIVKGMGRIYKRVD
jgi:SAM-dependent methyltransferase